MTRYRTALPQLSNRLFLTDGGIETSLIFHDGLDLPHFAAFHLFQDELGTRALDRYFRRYVDIAARHGTGFILESATWRASPDWGSLLGYSGGQLAAANRQAVDQLVAIRSDYEDRVDALVISGCVGPRGDGYDPGQQMSAAQAQDYHAVQIGALALSEADMITAITMTNSAEATGLARAAMAEAMPVAISFTVETDGRLPTGQPLAEAIEEVDEGTDSGVAYYMVNCAHTSHFDHVLDPADPRLARIRGLRGNASRLSHAELDEAEELDDGDPEAFGVECAGLRGPLRHLNVLGGCCGTDHRHVESCARAAAG